MKCGRGLLALILVIVLPAISLAAEEDALKFGFHADRLLVSQKTVIFQDDINKKIEEITYKLTSSSDKPLGKYIIRVMNDPVINAYSAAGGHLYINSGLLDILESRDELAFILGHEIAHTNQNDQVNFLVSAHQKQVTGKVVGTVLGAALGAGLAMGNSAAYGKSYQSSPIAQHMTSQMVDLGLQAGQLLGMTMSVSMIKGYGKKQELRADELAIENMNRAGYDPEASVAVFKKLAAIRDKLGSAKNQYASNLINSEPGLEQRLTKAQAKLGHKGNTSSEEPKE